MTTVGERTTTGTATAAAVTPGLFFFGGGVLWPVAEGVELVVFDTVEPLVLKVFELPDEDAIDIGRDEPLSLPLL